MSLRLQKLAVANRFQADPSRKMQVTVLLRGYAPALSGSNRTAVCLPLHATCRWEKVL